MIFQTEHGLVLTQLTRENWKIEYDPLIDDNTCAIYFSSHDIYYPNEESVFRERIVEGDAYEWYNTRRIDARKHIFVRDVRKQWYLGGVNEKLSSPELLNDFLKSETMGYRVVCIGSSAGGYAAVLHGGLLHAEAILCFNAQFDLNYFLEFSDAGTNPVVFAGRDSRLRKYFRLADAVKGASSIYYFYSRNSLQDLHQSKCTSGLGLVTFPFRTSHHGIPFLKSALSATINLSKEELERLASSKPVGGAFDPLCFAVRLVGFTRSCSYLYRLLLKRVVSRVRLFFR